MKTVYQTEISDVLTSKYLDFVINRVFALLPMFEESTISQKHYNLFTTYQRSLVQTVNGNVALMKYDSIIILDILSHLQSLFEINDHEDYRRHVLKICKLLSILKEEVESNGV